MSDIRFKLRKVAIHQPNFFPRLKILQKLANADTWIVLDNVQYCAREWQNRTKLVSIHSLNPFWFTIPVNRSKGQKSTCKEVRVVNPSTTTTYVVRTLRHHYRRSPYWRELEIFINRIKPFLGTTSLMELCVQTTRTLLEMTGFKPELKYASEAACMNKGSKLMHELSKFFGASKYLADSGGSRYLCLSDFEDIEIIWQHWTEPTTKWPGIQSWRDISCLDFLSREGIDQLRNHLESITLSEEKPI